MKDFGTMIQKQKPSGKVVKCAEIKPIPTSAKGFMEKQRHVFKIGEYNRATATFEMNSTADLSQKNPKPKFDLSSDNGVCNYFQSSFARSMVVNSSSKSHSLDYGCTKRNNSPIKEELSSVLKVQNKEEDSNGYKEKFCMVPGKESWDLRKGQQSEIRDNVCSTENFIAEQLSISKNAEVTEDYFRNQEYLEEQLSPRHNIPNHGRYLPGGSERNFVDTLVRSPLTSSCTSSLNKPYFPGSDVNSVILQSQVTTLQWQLRQAEASRQMYRAVMEQVVNFLQKTHKTLDILQNYLNDNDVENMSRVPRSRSVHGVETSPPQFSSPKSEINLSFQKAKSFVQIGDPDCPKHGTMYKELSWQKVRKQQAFEETNASKLSEEAIRLLRTIKSLFNTKEPDLTSRLSTSCSSPSNMAEVSSISSTLSAPLDSDNSDNIPLQGTLSGSLFKNSSPLREESSEKRMIDREMEGKDSPPQLSISSVDDESGFSSLNSFQEVGIPVSNFTFSHRTKKEQKAKQEIGYEDVGLPKIEDFGCKIHRRWSSTPADNHVSKIRPTSLYTNGEVLRVLWV